jgi:N-acetylmuramoyl-L-alanine amidase
VRIAIDAGHGGTDPGAVAGDTYESDITLAVAERLGHYLRSRGHETVFTRNGREFVTLQRRCDIANKAKADLFVSIHCNAAEAASANGSEVWYYNAGKSLAYLLHESLICVGKLRSRGVKQGQLYVCKHTDMPAALVELGFITNPGDLAKLDSDRWREDVACALAGAIDQYGQNGGEAA